MDSTAATPPDHRTGNPAAPTRARHHWLSAGAMGLLCLSGWAPAAPSPGPACALATAPGETLIDVPFEGVDGRIYLQVQVNDAGTFRFAVDTGASGVARADARLVRALHLPSGDIAAHSDGMRTADAATVRVDSLALGDVRRQRVVAITRDYNARQSAAAAFDGILARDFFDDGLLVLDFPRKRLRFRRDLGLLPEQPGTLAYTRAFRIPVQVGTVAAEAQLDTGANVALVLPTALYTQVSSGAVTPDDPLTLTHGRIESGRARLDVPLRVGGLTLHGLDVRVSDRYPEAVIGAHALRESVVLIDARSKRVALCPAQR
ncbi:aspartyl protease family protein [Stenotrophomonas sp. 24(2023)]|uniref:aspartyl protease family protein n=1 Tax=Stenotrophomonas sp. 24(2023) TaxID=3068324 RepID=UPI0027E0054F|nr:aspartyl protease family protein [Stenotrophomonas sp. 24(2023)]WMJ71297.1 aspartyl protease family protein [Stenotrophomonas sp. 24(2023)]